MTKTNVPTDLSDLSREEVLQILAGLTEDATPENKTSKQQADVLVEESPFTFTSGRVYLSGAMIEAAARVANTGSPELVKVPTDSKRTAAVVLWRTDEGSVAAQNLRTA